MAYARKSQKLWQENNKDKCRAYAAAYYKKNKERLNALAREWKRKNRAKVKAAQQHWYYSDVGKAYMKRTQGLRKEQQLKRWAKDPEKYIKASREWYHSKDGQKYMAAYRKKHRARGREHNKNWHEKNKHKVRTYYLVRKALEAGTIVKLPCEECGSKKDIRAAHNDYDKPLDITWLCRTHHMARQRHVPTKKERAAVLKRFK